MDEIHEKLQRAGLNPTPQRIAICRYVLCGADHPTADQVKQELERSGNSSISLATVYNTLNALVSVGLLKELRLSHSDKIIYDDEMLPHYHFLDVATGRLYDVFPQQIEVRSFLGGSFKVEGMEILLRGSTESSE